MATTTGTTSLFVLTRDQVITAALRKLRVINPTIAAASADITYGAEALNIMLKAWPTKGLLLWCRTQVVVPLVAAQTSYTIGPTGSSANVIAYRPLRVLDGSFIRYTVSGVSQDTPLRILSRVEYQQYSSKGTSAVVNSVYYDPQNGGSYAAYDPTKAFGTLYVFPTPSDALRSIYLETQRPLQEMNASGDLFDVPAEWYKALVYGLAIELSDEYEIPENRIGRLTQQFERMVEELVDYGVQEQAPLTFQPDYSFR